ncbi:MAG TPA: FtsX-like permease family protein, partial [Burkholderiaceae bacterium]
MFTLRLVWRNAFRARLRSALTLMGLAIALLAFGLLRTVVDSWYAGVEMAGANRIITRNAISLTFTMPSYYRDKIRAIDGVRRIAAANWFGGIWQDEKHFFAQDAVDLDIMFRIYPEFVVAPGELQDLLRDRQGCAIGRQLANLYGFRVGDRLQLRGTIYPGTWEFNVRAIYDGRDETTITRQMYFHYDLLNEWMRKNWGPDAADQVGVFLVQVDDPSRVAEVARRIDGEFANSLAATISESEKSFQLNFLAMFATIIKVVSGVSYVVIAIILAVAANTMAMTARERLAEYATLKALGFGPPFVARLILSESLVLAALGCAAATALTPFVAWMFFNLIGKSMFARFVVAPETY